MNKITKGAIAGGIGVALLLGGGGTLAYWTDQEDVGANATITAGNLDIAPAATPAPAWTVSNGSVTNAPVANIAAFRMVPGDVLTYTATYTVTATGNNIRAQASLGSHSIAAASGSAADTALAGRLTDTTVITVNGGAPTVTLSAGTHTVVVTATISWPFGNATSPTADNPAKQGAVNLSNFNVVITQVQPS